MRFYGGRTFGVFHQEFVFMTSRRVSRGEMPRHRSTTCIPMRPTAGILVGSPESITDLGARECQWVVAGLKPGAATRHCGGYWRAGCLGQVHAYQTTSAVRMISISP